jgi:FkbM family methyltransferase
VEPSRLVFTDVRVAASPRVEFCLDPEAGDPVADWLIAHGWIDEPVMRAFQSLVTPGARVLDLGCHLGTFSLPAAALGAQVIAVDAAARHVHLLRMAARRNGFDQLHTVHGAITDSAEPVPVLGINIHGRLWRAQDGVAPVAAVAPPVSVDGLLERHGWDRVDVIKMDIEGSEPAALRGMCGLLSRGVRPQIVFECNGAALPLFGSTINELRKMISELGYELLLLDHLRPGTLVAMAPDAIQPNCVSDYLALHSRPAGLGDRWTVESPFSREQAVTRLVEAAADAAPGYRRYGAEVLAAAPPWLRADPFATLAAQALRDDIAGEVRAAFESPAAGKAGTGAAEPPSSGAPEDVLVMAVDVSVPVRSEEPDRPLEAGQIDDSELALRNVSFHVRAGHSLAILSDDQVAGSAALAIVAGLSAPAAGQLTVRTGGILVSAILDVLEPELTIEENAIMYAAYLGCDVRTLGTRVQEAADRAGVGHLLATPLGELTEELQARLALSVAVLCGAPELLLIDRLPQIVEPGFRDWFRAVVGQLRASGSAVIQVVDDPHQAIIGADRMLWLHGAEAQSCGHPDSIVAARSLRRMTVARPR